MDYVNLILVGFCDENNRGKLPDYFYQIFKQAELQFYTPGLFFGGCFKAVESIENEIKKQFYKRKSELALFMSISKDSEAISEVKTEIESINLNDFPLNLNHISNKYFGLIYYSDAIALKKAILEAEIKINSEQKEKKERQISELEKSNKNQLTGFTCNLHPDTVKEIYIFMADKNYLSGDLTDFQAIFANISTPVKNPVKWLLKHNGKPNKTALFSFVKMMLELDEMPRYILRQANNLFKYGKENIFPEKHTYPNEKEQKSSIVTHFKPVKELIKKTRPA